MTPFEAECVEMIRRLETDALPRAELRLRTAERAVARAKQEIEAFRMTGEER